MNWFSIPAASKHKTKTDSSVLTKVGHIKVISSTPVMRNSHVSYSLAHLCIYQYTNPTGRPHVPGFHQIEVSQYRPPIRLNIVGQYLNQIKYRNFMFVSKDMRFKGKHDSIDCGGQVELHSQDQSNDCHTTRKMPWVEEQHRKGNITRLQDHKNIYCLPSC